MGGGTFFPNLKRGVTFFPEFNIKYLFFKKVCSIRNQSVSYTTELLFVSLSNTDLQRFCLIHKPHTESKTHTHTHVTSTTSS